VERHYLVPADFDNREGLGLRMKGVILETDVLTAMDNAAIYVVLIDACRSLSKPERAPGPGSAPEVLEGWGKKLIGSFRRDRAVVLAYLCSTYDQAGDGSSAHGRFTLRLLQVCPVSKRWCCQGQAS
jgi:hypothetical protein